LGVIVLYKATGAIARQTNTSNTNMRSIIQILITLSTTGKVVGGKLKTTNEADKESLQAGWFTSDVTKLPQEIPLR